MASVLRKQFGSGSSGYGRVLLASTSSGGRVVRGTRGRCDCNCSSASHICGVCPFCTQQPGSGSDPNCGTPDVWDLNFTGWEPCRDFVYNEFNNVSPPIRLAESARAGMVGYIMGDPNGRFRLCRGVPSPLGGLFGTATGACAWVCRLFDPGNQEYIDWRRNVAGPAGYFGVAEQADPDFYPTKYAALFNASVGSPLRMYGNAPVLDSALPHLEYLNTGPDDHDSVSLGGSRFLYRINGAPGSNTPELGTFDSSKPLSGLNFVTPFRVPSFYEMIFDQGWLLIHVWTVSGSLSRSDVIYWGRVQDWTIGAEDVTSTSHPQSTSSLNGNCLNPVPIYNEMPEFLNFTPVPDTPGSPFMGPPKMTWDTRDDGQKPTQECFFWTLSPFAVVGQHKIGTGGDPVMEPIRFADGTCCSFSASSHSRDSFSFSGSSISESGSASASGSGTSSGSGPSSGGPSGSGGPSASGSASGSSAGSEGTPSGSASGSGLPSGSGPPPTPCEGCGTFNWDTGTRVEPDLGGSAFMTESPVTDICLNEWCSIIVHGDSDDVVVMIGEGDSITQTYGGSPGDPVQFDLPAGAILFRDTVGWMQSSVGPTNRKTFTATLPTGVVTSYTFDQGSAANDGFGHVGNMLVAGFDVRNYGFIIPKTDLIARGWIDSAGTLRAKFVHITGGSGFARISSIECSDECPPELPPPPPPPSSSSSGSAGECFTVSPVIDADVIEYFDGGAIFPPGAYRIEYVSGALTYSTAFGQGYRVNVDTSATLGFWIEYFNGAMPVSTFGPGTGAEHVSDVDAQTDSLGTVVYIDHSGGQIGMHLIDTPYGDNAEGPTVGRPVFRLCPAGACPPPTTPADVAVNQIDFDLVQLDFTDAGIDETGFRIYRSDDGGPFVVVGEQPYPTPGSGTVQQFYDPGLTTGVEYCYYVVSFNACGESDPSPTVCVTML